MSVSIVIPAKSKSRRIPGKNMSLLGESPLISYTIDFANSIKSHVDEITVTTDCDNIAKFSQDRGCSTIIRPKNLCDDHISNQDVLRHYYERSALNNKHEIVALLQPTHPFRLASDFFEALNLFKSAPHFSSLMVFSKLKGRIGFAQGDDYISYQDQISNKNPLWKNTGSFYLFRPSISFLTPSFLGEKIQFFSLSEEGQKLEIDIDEPKDMATAEYILSENKHLLSYVL